MKVRCMYFIEMVITQFWYMVGYLTIERAVPFLLYIRLRFDTVTDKVLIYSLDP